MLKHRQNFKMKSIIQKIYKRLLSDKLKKETIIHTIKVFSTYQSDLRITEFWVHRWSYLHLA